MKYLLIGSVLLFAGVVFYIWTSTFDTDQWLTFEAWIVLLGLGFIGLIAVVAFGVWVYAAYKWMTRKKWQNGKTRNGNPRV